MGYAFEKYYPIGTAVIITTLILIFQKFIPPFNLLIPALVPLVLTLSATLVGFLLTIITIIYSINTRRMRFIKDAGRFDDLIIFLKKSIIANIVIILFSFLVLFINRDAIKDIIVEVIDFSFIFLVLFGIMLTTRFIIIFISLLTDKKQDNKSVQDVL